MKQFSDGIISKISAEIEVFCVDSDVSSDKALHMINFIRPLFEELREYIHKYNFQDNEEEIDFFKNSKPLILSKLIYYNDIYTLELSDNIVRLVPLYHSCGTVCDTLLVPLVSVVGIGTKSVI